MIDLIENIVPSLNSNSSFQMLLIFYIDLPIVEGDVVPLVFLDGDLGDICE